MVADTVPSALISDSFIFTLLMSMTGVPGLMFFNLIIGLTTGVDGEELLAIAIDRGLPLSLAKVFSTVSICCEVSSLELPDLINCAANALAHNGSSYKSGPFWGNPKIARF